VLIIACDYHPSVQQIAWTGTGTGECGERRLAHCADAEQFYLPSVKMQAHKTAPPDEFLCQDTCCDGRDEPVQRELHTNCYPKGAGPC
jgi:hypothetical protein